MPFFPTPDRVLGSDWWTGCWPARTMASNGDAIGLMLRATPTQLGILTTTNVPTLGAIETTSCARSMRISLTTNSSSSSLRATNCPEAIRRCSWPQVSCAWGLGVLRWCPRRWHAKPTSMMWSTVSGKHSCRCRSGARSATTTKSIPFRFVTTTASTRLLQGRRSPSARRSSCPRRT